MKREINNLSELNQFSIEFLEKIKDQSGATVIGLGGDLGSGKTAFVKLVAKNLGIEEPITSPTFVIMKIYEIPKHVSFDRLIHIDAYRLDGMKDLEQLGFMDLKKDKKNLIIIEWPELVGIEKEIHFQYVDKDKRLISYGK